MCGINSFITVEKDLPENNYLPINKAIISGSLSIGTWLLAFYLIIYNIHVHI